MAVLRIVRMVFEQEKTEAFLTMFKERSPQIRNFPSCLHLELWQDTKQATAYFTYSIWNSEQDLDHYRYSEFFRETWTLTKTFFADKPQAWTIIRVMEV